MKREEKLNLLIENAVDYLYGKNDLEKLKINIKKITPKKFFKYKVYQQQMNQIK